MSDCIAAALASVDERLAKARAARAAAPKHRVPPIIPRWEREIQAKCERDRAYGMRKRAEAKAAEPKRSFVDDLGLTETQRRIVQYMVDNPGASTPEVMRDVGISHDSLRVHVGTLRHKLPGGIGVIAERGRSTEPARWKVVGAPKQEARA